MTRISTRDATLLRDWLAQWAEGIAVQPDQTLLGIALSGFVLGINTARADPALADLMVQAIYVLDRDDNHNADSRLIGIARAEQALTELAEKLKDPTL